MRKSIAKIFGTVALMMSAVCFTGLGTSTAHAQGIDTGLAANDQYVSGSFTSGGLDHYTVNTQSAGWLTITCQATSPIDCSLYDEGQAKRYDWFNVWGSASEPRTKSITVALEPGKYRIEVRNKAGNASYNIKASFKAAGNNETEPNNVFSQAMSLAENQTVTGFISKDDQTDLYKVSIPTKRKITITVNSEISGYNYIKLYNSDYQEMFWQLLSRGSESEPAIMKRDVELEPGTYYLKVEDKGNDNILGRYSVKWETAPVLVSSVTIFGKKSVEEGAEIKLSAEVSPADASNKTLIWATSNDHVATIDQNGLVTGIKAGSATITASTTDNSQISVKYEITVKKPNVKKVSSLKATAKKGKKVTLTWKKQKSAKKYQVQIAKDKKFKTYLVDTTTKKNKSKLTIQYKLKGTAYVRVRAISKNGGKGTWSKTISVKVK